MPLPPDCSALQIRCFVNEKLGSGSARHAELDGFIDQVAEQIATGLDWKDATLGVLHRAAVAGDEEIANEFLGYFMGKVMNLASWALSPTLRDLLDTEDLLQSILTDLWPLFASVKFRTRAEFISFLAQRLKWKALDHGKKRHRDRRRDDLKTNLDNWETVSCEDTPFLEDLMDKEELKRLHMALSKLPEIQGQVLALFLRGESLTFISKELDLNYYRVSNLLKSAREGVAKLM